MINGNIPQTNVVRFNGTRATMLDIIKSGNTSTLDVVQGIKNLLPRLEQTLPKGLKLQLLTDQSVLVTDSINGVVREAAIAALLTALMILIFLGDWRSIAVFSALRQTINIMSLGGLALAVGLLVDDATVTIENVHRHMGEKNQPSTRFGMVPPRSHCRHWFQRSVFVSCLCRSLVCPV